MFIAQLGEAMIGTDEEIVAADVVVLIVWRTVGRYGFGEFTPLELDGVRELLPGKDGAVMHLGLVKLGRCAREYRLDFALVEALAVTMVEGDVAYAGPAVLDDGCGMELGHNFMVLVLQHKVTENLRSTSECV